MWRVYLSMCTSSALLVLACHMLVSLLISSALAVWISRSLTRSQHQRTNHTRALAVQCYGMQESLAIVVFYVASVPSLLQMAAAWAWHRLMMLRHDFWRSQSLGFWPMVSECLGLHVRTCMHAGAPGDDSSSALWHPQLCVCPQAPFPPPEVRNSSPAFIQSFNSCPMQLFNMLRASLPA